jgi:hypothetical protein
MLYTFLSAYIAPAILTALATALGLVILDTLLGVLIALKTSTFSFAKLPEFMETSFVPYVGGLILIALFSSFPGMSATFFTIAASIGVKFMADILSKINALFGDLGIQIQSPITKIKPAPVPLPKPQSVTPSTEVSTNTPAAEKTLPDENKEEAPATAQ